MNTEQAASREKESFPAHENVDFSLVLGGPLYQLLLRARLVRPPIELLHRRILAGAVITWLPLAVLTALGGSLLAGVSVPFLFDLDVHVKFLISLPLLIGAELIVHRRVRALVEQFLERGLIAPEDRHGAAELDRRRNTAPGACVYGWILAVAYLCDSGCRHLVRRPRGRIAGTYLGRLLVCVRQPADRAGPPVPLVLSPVHLVHVLVARVPAPAETEPAAPRPCGR